MKKLLAYVLLLAVVVAGISFYPSDVSAKRHGTHHNAYSYQYNEQFANQVLDLVNRERAKRGIAPMRWSTALQDPANLRASELTEYFSHTRPNGRDCFSVFPRSNDYKAENIAAGQSSPEEVVDCWMNSSGHRKNILNPHHKEMAVGYVYDEQSEYGHYWVQLFRGR